jgi:hypothetical protein
VLSDDAAELSFLPVLHSPGTFYPRNSDKYTESYTRARSAKQIVSGPCFELRAANDTWDGRLREEE